MGETKNPVAVKLRGQAAASEEAFSNSEGYAWVHPSVRRGTGACTRAFGACQWRHRTYSHSEESSNDTAVAYSWQTLGPCRPTAVEMQCNAICGGKEAAAIAGSANLSGSTGGRRTNPPPPRQQQQPSPPPSPLPARIETSIHAYRRRM